MNEIFLDTETTGLSFRDGHKIVEIACIETSDLIPTGKVFHKLLNPKRDMPAEAFKVHGFSSEFLFNKETFDKIADDLLNFINGKKIIIHNASFDMGFLNGELSSIKKNIINKKEVVDSLELGGRLVRDGAVGEVAARLAGHTCRRRDLVDAADVELLGELIRRARSTCGTFRSHPRAS